MPEPPRRILEEDAPPEWYPGEALALRPEGSVEIGRICGVHGIHGSVRVYSYTEPRSNILLYNPWLLCHAGRWYRVTVANGERHGKGIIARLRGCDERNRALLLIGARIAIERAQLAELEPGEYYWMDLLGLNVVNREGTELGVVDHLLETGAHDVLVVRGERERLIPFVTEAVVVDINLGAGYIRVDWDPEF
jgi:16S rRNA processing protein RimM